MRLACTCDTELASSFCHPTQVSTQVELASTCDYLPVRLARDLGRICVVCQQALRRENEGGEKGKKILHGSLRILPLLPSFIFPARSLLAGWNLRSVCII